tara:strand:- start:61 stop:207 length:147 start_codon:yes stop_codon:yes gene_type:complete
MKKILEISAFHHGSIVILTIVEKKFRRAIRTFNNYKTYTRFIPVGISR